MKALSFVLFAAALTVSENATAQEARPVRFWINVTDFKPQAQLSQYNLTADVAIPTKLVGWTCTASAVSLDELPALKANPAAGYPASKPKLYQSVKLVCASKSGSVSTRVSCALSSDNDFSSKDIDITGVAGTTVWVGVACRN